MQDNLYQRRYSYEGSHWGRGGASHEGHIGVGWGEPTSPEGYLYSLYNTGFIGIAPCRTTYVKEGTFMRGHNGAGGAQPLRVTYRGRVGVNQQAQGVMCIHCTTQAS